MIQTQIGPSVKILCNKKYGGPLDQRKRIKKNSDVEFPTKEVGTLYFIFNIFGEKY